MNQAGYMGQRTTTMRNFLESDKKYFSKVPGNMTNLYQRSDRTVNGYVKAFLKRMFTEWFATKITEALKKCKAVEDIHSTLNLSTLQPLQAK